MKYYFVKIRLILKNIWGKGKEKFHGFFFKEKKIKNPMIFIVKGCLFWKHVFVKKTILEQKEIKGRNVSRIFHGFYL